MHHGSNGTDRYPPSGTEQFRNAQQAKSKVGKRRYSHKIVDAKFNDSVDEWVLEIFINNTMEQFWDWKKQNNIEDIQFEVETPWLPHDYSSRVIINACTDDPVVAAELKIKFAEPVNKLNTDLSHLT